jgi:nitrite reductase/ring-hydroxylating ferredoxin subunit
MEYVRVINQAELPANSMTVVTVGDKQVLLANVDGAIHAIANKCTHLGASLGKGVL